MMNEIENNDKPVWRKNLLNSAITIITVMLAFVAGYLFSLVLRPPELDLVTLAEAKQLLQDNALYDLPEEQVMEYGMIYGMLNTYEDPHTRFLEPVQHELNSDRLEGSYGGIGSRLGRDEENFIVLFPFEGSPAAEGGIEEGDRLVGVDGVPITAETTFDDAVTRVRGPEGQKVEITVARPPDYEEFTFDIKRGNIPTPSVTSHLATKDARIGVIEINVIADSTPDEIEKAITELQERGATHFVMDLRNNGGGLLNAGVDIARMFLDDGVVIERQYKGEEAEPFKVTKTGVYADLPMVVLVNENTASAAEIIAGAMRAHEKAILIGRQTYGKNTIQLVFELNDGSSLHVTAANWWVPGIDFPQPEGGGMLVDVQIDMGDTETADAIAAAIEYFFND